MIHLKNLEHSYPSGWNLRLEDWQIETGKACLLLGSSGSGKSTLLQIIAGMLLAKKGEVWVNDVNLSLLGESQRDRFRVDHMGLVLQGTHFIPTLNVLQNLLLAQFLARKKQSRSQCEKILNDLDLADKSQAYLSELSQGQVQRVACARALLNHPPILLADEPTANLDDANAEQVIQLLRNESQARKCTLIVATHDARVKKYFKNIQQL